MLLEVMITSSWIGIGQFGADWQQISLYLLEQCTVSFDGDMLTLLVQLLTQAGQLFSLHEGFSTSNYHLWTIVGQDCSYCIFDWDIFIFRLPTGIGRVAPNTTQVAVTGAKIDPLIGLFLGWNRRSRCTSSQVNQLAWGIHYHHFGLWAETRIQWWPLFLWSKLEWCGISTRSFFRQTTRLD